MAVGREAVGELHGENALGPVGSDVTLADRKALAGGNQAADETGPDEWRTGTEAIADRQMTLAF